MSEQPKASGRIDQIEETLIAALLGVMTLITFANVVIRTSGGTLLWAKETTEYLFAWMVLLGASYGVKHQLHIGVDVMLNALPPKARKICGLIAVAGCLTFSLLLLKGAWDYWWPTATNRAWLEVEDIRMPSFLQFLSDWLNEGEAYEKLPRFIPYAVLPLSMALLTYRFAQVGWHLWTDQQEMIIASHEGEDLLKEQESKEQEASK